MMHRQEADAAHQGIDARMHMEESSNVVFHFAMMKLLHAGEAVPAVIRTLSALNET
jgi:hypothetical protein